MDLTGYTLGNQYELIALIGSGAMSSVYRARDHQLDIEVAVKVLAWHLANDLKAQKRFREEAQKAARLIGNSNIISVTNVGRDQGWDYMVMQLIHGETLAARLDRLQERSVRMPHDDIVDIVKQVAMALDFAHSQGIFHRDVKPANIMIDRDGHVTLVDFGLVKALDSVLHLTGDWTVMGTAAYMSPEQARGYSKDQKDAKVLRRMDVYSLGCVVFEMLTGRPPYQGDARAVVTGHASNDPVPSIREFESSISESVSRVVMGALEKSWANRTPSAGAFAKALADGVGEIPPPPDPVGSIGGLVWQDSNRDGIRNRGEPGIAGVRITLVEAGPDGQLNTADDIRFPDQVTASSGTFLFDELSVGLYRVVVDTNTLPSNVTLRPTTRNQPLDIDLRDEPQVRDADMGYPPRPEPGGIIPKWLKWLLLSVVGLAAVAFAISRSESWISGVASTRATEAAQAAITLTARASDTAAARERGTETAAAAAAAEDTATAEAAAADTATAEAATAEAAAAATATAEAAAAEAAAADTATAATAAAEAAAADTATAATAAAAAATATAAAAATATAAAAAAKPRLWIAGPPLTCSDSCTRLQWQADGFDHVFLFSEGTSPGDRKPASGVFDNWCFLQPGEQARLILRAVRADGSSVETAMDIRRDDC